MCIWKTTYSYFAPFLLFYFISIFQGFPKDFSWEGGTLSISSLFMTMTLSFFPIQYHPLPLHLNHSHHIILLHVIILHNLLVGLEGYKCFYIKPCLYHTRISIKNMKGIDVSTRTNNGKCCCYQKPFFCHTRTNNGKSCCYHTRTGSKKLKGTIVAP